MKVVIRNIQSDDYQQTIEVIQKSIRISMGKIYPTLLLDEFCKKYEMNRFLKKVKEIKYFVAEDITTKRILGVIGLKDNTLRTFFVDPDFQGQGIGRKLYTKLEQTAIQRGIKKLHLEGSPLGEPVYKKFGFKKVCVKEKERIGIHYKDAIMTKKIT